MSFETERYVHFADVDAAGIVYFARILEYAHEAFEAFLQAIGFALPKTIGGGVWGSPIVHVEADYAAPLRHGDRLVVRVHVARIGTRSFAMGYTLVGQDGRLHATAQTVHATVSRSTFAPVAVPDAFRAALAPHLDGENSA